MILTECCRLIQARARGLVSENPVCLLLPDWGKNQFTYLRDDCCIRYTPTYITIQKSLYFSLARLVPEVLDVLDVRTLQLLIVKLALLLVSSSILACPASVGGVELDFLCCVLAIE
jgi:hypothetical protein